jgi:hypothetical protein
MTGELVSLMPVTEPEARPGPPSGLKADGHRRAGDCHDCDERRCHGERDNFAGSDEGRRLVIEWTADL